MNCDKLMMSGMQVNVNSHVYNLNSCENKTSKTKARPQRDFNYELCKVPGAIRVVSSYNMPVDCH